MSRKDELIQHAKEELDAAKREPGHSPTEDHLIDALEYLIFAMRQP